MWIVSIRNTVSVNAMWVYWGSILIIILLMSKPGWWSNNLRCCETYVTAFEINFDFKVENMLFLVERKGNILHLLYCYVIINLTLFEIYFKLYQMLHHFKVIQLSINSYIDLIFLLSKCKSSKRTQTS